MDEQQLQQQIMELVHAAMQGDQQATQQIQQIMQAAQQGNQLAVELAQMIQAAMQQVRTAKLGTKLNYIKQLRGICPDGYEMQYFQKGGRVCKQCVQMKKEIKSPIDAFKCGRKVNRKKK